LRRIATPRQTFQFTAFRRRQLNGDRRLAYGSSPPKQENTIQQNFAIRTQVARWTRPTFPWQ
jgi:hypothetical protein